jgi:hypothetical protein
MAAPIQSFTAYEDEQYGKSCGDYHPTEAMILWSDGHEMECVPTGMAVSVMTVHLDSVALHHAYYGYTAADPGLAMPEMVTAVGGDELFHWSITEGTLPAGLTLNTATGVIGGTPSGPTGTFRFTVTATDTATPSQSASANLSIRVLP